ncbi:hypothetical protein Btru_054837 [Bulinus truncatus]|nr:hypothetical protein Btru_054837 [Bulinus truncatus]
MGSAFLVTRSFECRHLLKGLLHIFTSTSEYFERKRSQLNHSTRMTDSPPNTVLHKKSKLSQDIISFQRKCRMNKRQAIRPDQNYRRVDLNSRTLAKVTGANRFGVNSVELPLSPIQQPSRLQLISPTSRVDRNQDIEHGVAKKGNSNPRQTYQCSIPVENNSYLQLFGEPVDKHQNFITTMNQPYDVHNCSPFDIKTHSAIDTFNVIGDVVKLYSPRRHSRDLEYSIPFSSEMENTDRCPTESYSLYNNRNDHFSDDGHILPQINEISRFQVDPHYQEECKSLDSLIDPQSSVCSSQTLFHENSYEDNFYVHIVPSPESPQKKWVMSPNTSQDDLSSETSTLIWPHAVDYGTSKFGFNSFQLPESCLYTNNMSTISQTCYPDLISRAKTSNRQVHKQFAILPPDNTTQEINNSLPETHMANSLPKTHMTTIKETHRRKKTSEYSKWQKYFQNNDINKLPLSPSYLVSNGLDHTPDTRSTNDLTNTTRNIAPSMSTHEFCDKKNSLQESKTENVNNIVSLGRNEQSSRDTVQKEKKNVLATITNTTENEAPTLDSKLALSNKIERKKLIQDGSLDVEEMRLKNCSMVSTPTSNVCVSVHHCNNVIKQSRDSVKYVADSVTSSPYVYEDKLRIADDVSVLSESKKQPVSINSVTLSTQTTPVLLIDTSTSPIRELGHLPCGHLYEVNDCNISSSEVDHSTTNEVIIKS